MSCLPASRHTLSLRMSGPVDFAPFGPARLRVKPFEHAVRNVWNAVTQPSANQRRAPDVTPSNGRVVYVRQQNDGSKTETLRTGNSPGLLQESECIYNWKDSKTKIYLLYSYYIFKLLFCLCFIFHSMTYHSFKRTVWTLLQLVNSFIWHQYLTWQQVLGSSYSLTGLLPVQMLNSNFFCHHSHFKAWIDFLKCVYYYNLDVFV